MGKEKETWDQRIQGLTPAARETAARARNAKIRQGQHEAARMEEARNVRAHVRSLHHRHGLTAHRIAKILDYSRTRIVSLLEK